MKAVQLRTLARHLADRLITGFINEPLQAAIHTFVRADGLISVTPYSPPLRSADVRHVVGQKSSVRLLCLHCRP
ncbi:hypothetical protein [Geodermatophilus sp. DSM 45219]|uniref:hypothetical protein n=1 Tax=Geodermatophilus sp. DSM 45219 TaxID=1881103 RepID=UPI000B853BC8|nr:hypothetical protein [Geodermatophilus sp. DSM 45219]